MKLIWGLRNLGFAIAYGARYRRERELLSGYRKD